MLRPDREHSKQIGPRLPWARNKNFSVPTGVGLNVNGPGAFPDDDPLPCAVPPFRRNEFLPTVAEVGPAMAARAQGDDKQEGLVQFRDARDFQLLIN